MDLYDSMLASSSSNRLQRARVRSVPAQHSWAALPGPLVSKLLDSGAATPLVLKLLPALTPASQAAAGRGPFSNSSANATATAAAAASLARPRYVAWGGNVASSPGCIELPAHLAAALQLPPGLEVQLEVVPRLAPASAVVLEPVGPADWEVVELNAGLLEEHVLGQAGVVTLGQPLVVWARQAKVTLKVTQILHDSTPAAAAAAAGGGALLFVKDVARLDQGTELHIAPKPRVAAAGAGSSLAPGQLPLGAADSSSKRQQAQQQQQQQQRKPVWLRVCNAGTQHLLSTTALPGLNGSSNNSSNSSSSSSSSSAEQTAGANSSSNSSAASGGASAAAAAAAAVSSWLTTAVHVSSQTCRDLCLRPGDVARLYGVTTTSSSSSSSSARGQSVLPLQSLVVVLLVDDSVPWGQVALAPPLQQALGCREHVFVKLRPLYKQRQLQQLPGLLLHPLMPAGSSSAGGSGLEGLWAAATSGSAAATGAAAATAAVGGGGSGGRQRRVPNVAAGAASVERHHQQQQQQQAQRADSFSGPGLVIDTVKGLLATPLQVFRLQSSLQQQQQQQLPGQQQQQRQGDKQGDLAAATAGSGTVSVDSGPVAGGLVTPQVAGAAVMAWMQLQLAAGSSSSIPSSEAESDAASSNGQSVAGDACLPVCGPMLVHFRVSTQQQQQQQQQQHGCAEYLLLLVPVGEQLQGAAGSAGVSYLPADLLLPPGPTSQGPQQQQQQQQKVSVQVVKPLVYELPTTASAAAGAAAVSQVAQQHAQYVSCIVSAQENLSLQPAQPPTDGHQQQQQQQQQQGWLDAADFPWLQPALQSAVQRLQPRLDLLTWQSWQSVQLPLPGGVLLVGGSEGGRAWLLQLLGQQAAAVHGAHVLKVSCKSLAGQSYETAAAVLAAAAAEAVSCCPGLLLLDDLELLMPAPNTEGPVGLEQDQATATRLADWLAGLVQWAAQQPHPLSFCAAVSAAAALPASLRAPGCLDCEVKVPVLGLQGRAALLLSGFRAKGLEFEGGLQGLEALAGKGLEGFDARDIQLVVDRAVHSALRRGITQAAAGRQQTGVTAAAVPAPAAAHSGTGGGGDVLAGQAKIGSDGQQQQQQQQQQLLVTAEDVQQALSGYVAAALWRAGQHKGQQAAAEGRLQGWEDVGGLYEAVSALKEALVLPAKYGHLLAAAPLRLRTGLLLFGPPGCGKTHVAAAAVAATGARLISVKGPELLNKYIGQSEAAVRELFGRAAAAAPCVLFFDEFDAIAPPRGHDSTGVTDRVVNQLLTELDGVEGLTGVAVLAATSRPDLIDAALLRPGRLDRMVYCGFPAAADRLAILQAVGRKLVLGPGVSLQDVAACTEGFTGADLAAVLSEAQLLAVHEQIDAHPAGQPQEGGGSTATAAACVLTSQHVQRALSRARPSLPATEKQRLEAVYARFQQSRDPGLSNRPAVPEEQQGRVKHATLA